MIVYFEQSQTVLILGLTVYVLGFAIGPLLWAPLSELYGRRIIFIVTFAPFVVFQIGCATARNIETLILCRWFAGFFGSSPITNAGAIISDTFPASTRALALSLYVCTLQSSGGVRKLMKRKQVRLGPVRRPGAGPDRGRVHRGERVVAVAVLG